MGVTLGVAVALTMGVAVTVTVTMRVGVLVLVMVALVTTWPGRSELTGEVILDRLERVGLVGSHRYDPAARHALAETLAERACDQDIDGIKRMRACAVPVVHGKFLGEVKTIDLLRLGALLGFEHQEPPCPPRVRGDGAKVLAGDCKFHVSFLLLLMEGCYPMAGANLKGGQKEGGGAQRGCLLPAPAPFAAPRP